MKVCSIQSIWVTEDMDAFVVNQGRPIGIMDIVELHVRPIIWHFDEGASALVVSQNGIAGVHLDVGHELAFVEVQIREVNHSYHVAAFRWAINPFF